MKVAHSELVPHVVSFQNVCFRYENGPQILNNISFSLKGGSFHFLTGTSGAGKSTLLKLMYLGNVPDSGALSIFGRNVRTITRRELPLMRQKIGVVFQDFNLIPHMSCLDNVALPLKISGYSAKSARIYAAELLAWVGLGDCIEYAPETLSGGQKQRVAIARAVITQPLLLLADEPTGNVDDQLAIKLLYLFEELNKMGTTVVIATHNRTVANQFCYPVMHLDRGRFVIPEYEYAE